MAVITSENRNVWQALADNVSVQRPSVGKRVKIIGGRKHRGKLGTVKIHKHSKFGDAFRYGGEANLQLREMAGRYGFTVLVQPDDGGKDFWVPADYTEVLGAV